jgi:hypothetical protein
MAVRAQIYQGLLWQQVIQEKRLDRGAPLPPLLLLVLYNGTQRWSAPTETSELIGLQPDSRLWHWQPRVRYCLLDMGAVMPSRLSRGDSLVALLFRLERPCSLSQLEVLIEAVAGWFRRHEGFAELKRLFCELVWQVVRSTGTRVEIPNDLLEVKSMLATLGKTWRDQWRAEAMAEGLAKGLAKGLAEGLAKGSAKGLASGLEQLLVSRFGALPPSVRKQIRGAELATIEKWFNRALDARDLQAVFGRQRRRLVRIEQSDNS